MTGAQIAQIASALFVAITPWCVVRIAFAVAARHARSLNVPVLRPPIVKSLGRLTGVAVAVAGIAGVSLAAPSIWMAAVDAAIFVPLSIVALRALGAIDEASRPAREVPATARAASLRPRHLSDYLPSG